LDVLDRWFRNPKQPLGAWKVDRKKKGCLFPKIGVPFGTPKWMVKIMENPIEMDDYVSKGAADLGFINSSLVGGNSTIFHFYPYLGK